MSTWKQSHGRNPANQLRLVVYPIIYKVLYIPGGAGFLPSTVASAFVQYHNHDIIISFIYLLKWINTEISAMTSGTFLNIEPVYPNETCENHLQWWKSSLKLHGILDDSGWFVCGWSIEPVFWRGTIVVAMNLFFQQVWQWITKNHYAELRSFKILERDSLKQFSKTTGWFRAIWKI